MASELTLGPVLFKWPAEDWRDFYYRIADEAPVGTVYLGEVVCSKRVPFIEPYYDEVTERLQKGGKTVVFSTLSEVISAIDRKVMERTAAAPPGEREPIEVNDVSALWHLDGRPHAIGPFMNVYNEDTLAFLASKGAKNICLPPELPASAIKVMGARAKDLGVSLEVQVYGRVPLALSARCYHARAHGKTKDSCQYVCEQDADGMALLTLTNEPFLAINGIQTLSFTCLNLVCEMDSLGGAGVTRFRISPHSNVTFEVASVFNAVLEGEMDFAEAMSRLKQTGLKAPFSNGFLHRAEGHRWLDPGVFA